MVFIFYHIFKLIKNDHIMLKESKIIFINYFDMIIKLYF